MSTATTVHARTANDAVDAFAAVAADIGCLKRELGRMLQGAGCPGTVQLGAMAVLAHLDKVGDARLSQVAQQLHVDLSVISRHVRTLEDHGFVQRTTDADDRRAQLISVTAAGQGAMRSVRDAATAQLSAVLAGWDDEDVGTLRRLLDRLHHDLVDLRAAR
jgi:DNA-binding MarR family transcriptional regulator